MCSGRFFCFIIPAFLLLSSCSASHTSDQESEEFAPDSTITNDDTVSLVLSHGYAYSKFYKDWDTESRGTEYHVMIYDSMSNTWDSISIDVDYVTKLLPGENENTIYLASVTGSGACCNLYRLDLTHKEEPNVVIENVFGTCDVERLSDGFVFVVEDEEGHIIRKHYNFSGKILK